MVIKTIFTIIAFLGYYHTASSQVEVELPSDEAIEMAYDTTYIKSYRDELNARFYASYKYTSFTIPAIRGSQRMTSGLAFRPNSTFNNGFGLTHKGFTLNLGTGFPGINGDGSERGKSKIIDFQMHMYMRKQVIDLYVQRYQGFYHNQGAMPTNDAYYSDPNTKLRQFGLGYTRIHNHKKFTFRPANLHDEQQLKSAGSLLYGFDFVYAQVKNAENPILAPYFNAQYPYLADVSKLHTYNFGPSVGYAYNWIFAPHFFFMASASVSVQASFYQDRSDLDQLEKVNFNIVPAAIGRTGIGYNNDNWAFSIYAVHGITSTSMAAGDYNLATMHTGNYRASIVKRFKAGPKAKKILTPWYWLFK